MRFNCPVAYQKGFLTEYELFSANNMLLICLVWSILNKKLVIQLSCFLVITCLSLGLLSIRKVVLPYMSLFLLFPWSLLSQLYIKSFVTPYELLSANCMTLLAKFSIEKLLLAKYELFSINYMQFPGPILYQKEHCYPI